jgi:aspartate kinase
MAATLRELGLLSTAVESTNVIVTDDEYLQAEPLMPEVRERSSRVLAPLLHDGITPVVTGFIGATADGVLTTLGRGGSDYSATTLGAALDANEIIIWTDVDGVLTADPRLVPDARLLREISYNEAAELAYFGAKVLHPKTLRPVVDARIPVWIRNSFYPEKTGTRITTEGHPTEHGVRAITSIPNVSMITIGGRGIVGVVGVAAKTFQTVASVRANVLLISQSSSENDICLIVDSADASQTVKALRSAFAADLKHHDVEHITVDSNIAIVAVVGEKMRGTPGIAGRTFSALGRRGINIIAIAQGSSEYNVSFVVEAGAMRDAVSVVHEEFQLHVAPQNLANLELNTLLDQLARTPDEVEALLKTIPTEMIRVRPSSDEFSPVENACHLRDIEVDGYAARIARILNEHEPSLADINGAQLAIDRDYNNGSLPDALRAFRLARGNNIALLRTLDSSKMDRKGYLEGVGEVTLRKLLSMMDEHDRGHLDELKRLVIRAQ